MLTVISPAKTLDFETPPSTRKSTVPLLLDRSAELVEEMQQLSPDDIRALMGVSEKIAELNHRRFMNWSPCHPCLLYTFMMREGRGREPAKLRQPAMAEVGSRPRPPRPTRRSPAGHRSRVRCR